jgi:hypothetical protein
MIVGFWLLETPFNHINILPADATVLRAARLFKLLRFVKVIKTLKGFDSLYLLVKTLTGSVQILGWSCVLLFVVQTMIAFCMVFLLNELYFSGDHPVHERKEVFEYFGTFCRAILSMFEMTLGNWPPVCRLLVEHVSEWFMILFITHKLTIGFAVIGVINGVFMQETFKVASSDDRILMRQKESDVKIYGQKMRRLFAAIDQDCSGAIDQEEFGIVMEDHEIMSWMSSLDLPVRDHKILFHLLDVDGNGVLSPEELVRGILQLRGNAKTIDVIGLERRLESVGLTDANKRT